MPVHRCLLCHFCQFAVIQLSRLERNSAVAWKKTELVLDSPCCGKDKLSTEQSTRPENLVITNTKPASKVYRQNKMQNARWAIQCGEEMSKYVFTATNFTTAKTTCSAVFKCRCTNLCFWWNLVVSHSKLSSCPRTSGWAGKGTFCCCLSFQHRCKCT